MVFKYNRAMKEKSSRLSFRRFTLSALVLLALPVLVIAVNPRPSCACGPIPEKLSDGSWLYKDGVRLSPDKRIVLNENGDPANSFYQWLYRAYTNN